MTTVPKFEANELVDVAIRGARIRAVDDQGVLYVGDNDELMIDPTARNITVTRVAPKEWPPQPGDIWEDRFGSEWYSTGGAGLVDAHGGGWSDVGEILAAYGPLKLVRRRGWTPTPEATDGEPAEVDERVELVAGLRALATLLESYPELPAGYIGSYGPLLDSLAEVQQWANALGVEVDAHPDKTGAVHHAATGQLAGLHVRAFWIESAPVLGDDVDDPADTGARTGCECDDCENIEAGQLDAADADQTTADAVQVLAAVAEDEPAGVCNCESYDCEGECCGVGNCSCTPGPIWPAQVIA